uniref:Uncharacterized protein n=1 Tax=Megaselia scalaris TaxID=36166 RepID=T1GYY5_MEGSC
MIHCDLPREKFCYSYQTGQEMADMILGDFRSGFGVSKEGKVSATSKSSDIGAMDAQKECWFR